MSHHRRGLGLFSWSADNATFKEDSWKKTLTNEEGRHYVLFAKILKLKWFVKENLWESWS